VGLEGPSDCGLPNLKGRSLKCSERRPASFWARKGYVEKSASILLLRGKFPFGIEPCLGEGRAGSPKALPLKSQKEIVGTSETRNGRRGTKKQFAQKGR